MAASRLRLGLFLLVLSALVSGPAEAKRQGLPADSTPMTITYTGSFDLTNTMVPTGMPHSFTYHVDWTYSWIGTWGQLFDGAPRSLQTSFATRTIKGTIHSQWRRSRTGPDITCTLRIGVSHSDFPDFVAAYNAGKGTLQIDGLESPTQRYGHVNPPKDVMCGGSPDIDMFSVPRSWSPLGPRALTVPLSGGERRFDKTWAWHHSFDSEQRRDYTSSMHASLKVSFSG